MHGRLGSRIDDAVAAVAAAAVGALVDARRHASAGPTLRPTHRQRSRTADGKPDFSGIWQALNEAHWDLEAHEARPGAVMQQGVYPYEYARVPAAPVLALGAAGGVPGSVGVVEGDGKIPYKPEAAKIKKENGENWIDRDPELKCYLPGIPRAMYMPYPFQIVQSANKVHMAFAFTSTGRTIHLDEVEGPPDFTYMGHSVGRWEGDTLVVDVTEFNGKNWFDRAGNYHSEALHLTERFTPITQGRHPLRGDHRGSERVHPAVEDLDAALSPAGAERAAARIPLHRVRRGVHVRRPPQAAARDALGRRDA